MENNKIFRMLIISLYGSVSYGKSFVSTLLNLSDRTVRNYIYDRSDCPKSVILALELERIKQNTVKVSDFYEHIRDWDKAYSRIFSTSTSSDSKKLISYLYHNRCNIKKIILFSIIPKKNTFNKYAMGCVFISNNENVILDTSGLTGERVMRSLEIGDFIRQIFINNISDKTYFIDEIIPRLDNLNPKEAIEKTLKYSTKPLTSNNLSEFHKKIAGHIYFDPSSLVCDSGDLSINHILKSFHEEFKLDYKVKDNEYFINCPENHINVFDRLIFLISHSLDISETIDKSDNSYYFLKEYFDEMVEIRVSMNKTTIHIKRVADNLESYNRRLSKKISNEIAKISK